MATGDWQATGVSIDTRTLQPGDLFVALKDARDGHDFVAEAFDRGASAALVSRIPPGVGADAPLLRVDDVLAGLQALGRAARARTQARLIAVTGSAGKTSTKEMLRVMLAGQGRVHASEASYNNHWGVPLTLARMPADTTYAVIEIGMNHPGEIAPLVAQVRPHVALVTNVLTAHLAAFDGLEAIAEEKAAIFTGLEPGGVAVINADLPVSGLLAERARSAAEQVIGFGEGDAADARLVEAQLRGNVTVCHLQFEGCERLFKLNAAGRHFALNAAGALAAVSALGADLDVAVMDLADWRPPAGRGRMELVSLDPVEEGLEITLIDDAYNANPASMAAALDVLAATEPADGVGRVVRGRRIAVLGDMLELGPEEMQLHASLANLPALERVELVHCVGPRMAALYEALPMAQRGHWAETVEDLLPRLSSMIDAGDVLLVKGSKGSRVSLVVDAVRKLGHPRDRANKGAA